jgi:hypothetical protein
MTNEEKVQAAISMLQELKWNRDSNWLANSMRIDEVLQMLRTPSPVSAAVNTRHPRAGLSDRLIALIGKPSRNTRAAKTKMEKETK